VCSKAWFLDRGRADTKIKQVSPLLPRIQINLTKPKVDFVNTLTTPIDNTSSNTLHTPDVDPVNQTTANDSSSNIFQGKNSICTTNTNVQIVPTTSPQIIDKGFATVPSPDINLIHHRQGKLLPFSRIRLSSMKIF
jgi:hypothetical protein